MEIPVPALCDPSRGTLAAALSTARRRASEQLGYDNQISEFLYKYWQLSSAAMPVIERALRVFAEIAPAARLQTAFRAAADCPNARVRSKAVLILGQRIDSIALIRRFLADADARVRANTVEILWGRKPDEVLPIFMSALTDLHHRVAANALYGLHAIDAAKCIARVGAFASHMHPRFRGAAAWVVGKVGDKRNVGLLKPLLVDPNADVRRSASKAVGMLRAAAA